MKILLVSKETVDKTVLIIIHKEIGERDLGPQDFRGFHAGTPLLEIKGGTLELGVI